MYSLRYAAHSEVGRIRKNNQDAAYASPTLLLVCDGMGGAAAGDLASAVAATEASKSDRRFEDPEEMLEAIAGIITRANGRLGELVEEDLSIDGMGTTFCGGLFNGRQMAVGHIGDSRGYLLRDGELTQFTHDHSWVQSLIDEGKITPEQAATHPHRSLILRVLNGQELFEPDLMTLDLQEGDRILFCSDGLSGLVPDWKIRDVLTGHEHLEEAIQRLARMANLAGGHDNITLVVGEVVAQDDALDARAGALYGSATEVEIPVVGALAAKAGKPTGYPESPSPPEAVATDQEPEEAARYAPKEQHHRWPGVLIALVAIALVIGAGAWGISSYAQSRYFIAAESGQVAIYNGLPGNILGYPLNAMAEGTDIQVADLPAFHQRAVNNTIGVPNLDAARATTQELRVIADRCRAVREERLKPAEPAVSPTPTASPTIPGLPAAPGTPPLDNVEPGYPTQLAPMTPTATAEADPESC